jgi:predicted O-methyltransferase YrrM
MSAQNCQHTSSTAVENSIAGRIMQLRQMQHELRTRPVTGSSRVGRALKRLLYKAVHPAFMRQFTLNAVTLDLIETIAREATRNSDANHQADEVAQAGSAVSPAQTVPSNEVLASCGQTQDQAKLNNIRPLLGFESVYSSPAEMRMPERVALYSLIFGMQPRNCLEIGTFRGGSTAIICGAMDDTGFGQLTCIDPQPKIDEALWARLSNRCRLFEGPSPDILQEVAKQIKAPFDFALIDANHTYDYVRRDISGVLPYMADNAYLLFHDANYPDVKRAIDEAVADCDQLTDCGLVSIEPTVLYDNGQTTTWAGLRLLRFQRPVGKAQAA